MDLKDFAIRAKQDQKQLKKFLDRLKKRPPKHLDQMVMALDSEVFEETDCLSCANCCKTLSPIFKQRDIDRLASHLGMKPGDFVEAYLRVDGDGDYVLQQSPCAFLNADNTCQVYDERPKACREYPHTAERKFHARIGITQKNVLTCPAAHQIVTRLMDELEG